jgi:hypothetical protein
LSKVASIVALMLTVGAVEGSPLGPFPSYAAPTNPTVTLSGARIGQSNAAVADFDADGDKEIVIGGEDGRLYVIARTGSTWSVVWSRQTANDLNAASAPSTGCETTVSDIRSSPAIGDLDDDGHLEIAVTTGGDPARHRNGGVLIYRYTSPWSFALVPGWPQPKLDIVGLGAGASNPDGCWDGIWGSPTLGDLDGDGDLEVAVEGFDRRLHVWHHNGQYVAGWPIVAPTIYRGGWSTPAIADVDRDSLPEVIFATDYKKNGAYLLYVFNSDASLLPGFPVQASQNMVSSPAIGDINGDGWLDIVVGTGTYESSGGNKVYAWDHNGNLLPGWPQVTGSNMPASPALGDLDGDGDVEIVIGCGAEGDAYPPPCSSLYAWHGDGSMVNGFPVVVGPNNPWSPPGPPNGLPYSPVLVDYDGDSSIEILVVNRWSWGISTVESDANPTSGSAFQTQNTLESSPLVDDVDGDGKLEVVIGGANSNGNSGAVYIWDVNGNADDARPWPMFHHNVGRTGRYPMPPRLGFPDKIRLFHQNGSGDTQTGYAWVHNEGEGKFDWSIAHAIAGLQTTPSSGPVTDMSPVHLAVTTVGLSTGWYTLGTLTVSGSADGKPVEGSPTTATLYLFVGDVSRAYLPAAVHNH